jgi:hypothetical protein
VLALHVIIFSLPISECEPSSFPEDSLFRSRELLLQVRPSIFVIWDQRHSREWEWERKVRTPEIARDVGKRAVVVGSMASKLNGKIEEQRWNIGTSLREQRSGV